MYDSYDQNYGEDNTPDIDFDTAVDEIVESREGRFKWSMVDSDLRIWDAMIIGNAIVATTEELAGAQKQIVIPIKPE